MKEIKFRGQRSDNNQWVYGNLISVSKESTKFTTELTTGIQVIENGSFKAVFQIKPETVGQFWNPCVGLECYGGDLFEAECSVYDQKKPKKQVCKVFDSATGFEAAIWYKNEWHAYASMNYTTAKVIGNIHDNPELLKP